MRFDGDVFPLKSVTLKIQDSGDAVVVSYDSYASGETM